MSALIRLAKYTSLCAFLYALIEPLGYKAMDFGFLSALTGIASAELQRAFLFLE